MSKKIRKANGKPAREAAASRIEKHERKAAYALAREDAILARDQAQRRLRQTAAEWVAGVNYALSSLVDEFSRVTGVTERPGELLADVLDHKKLVAVQNMLEAAEQRIGDLRAAGVAALDLPDVVGEAKEIALGLVDVVLKADEARRAAEGD